MRRKRKKRQRRRSRKSPLKAENREFFFIALGWQKHTWVADTNMFQRVYTSRDLFHCRELNYNLRSVYVTEQFGTHLSAVRFSKFQLFEFY